MQNETAPLRGELLLLLRQKAFAKRPVILASGAVSDFYIDCKQVSLDARGHVLIGSLFFEALGAFEAKTGARVDGVGGLTLGADPLASALSMTSSLRGRPVPAFIVRKEPKAHGTEAFLEGMGNIPAGGQVVVLEDVITTGGSALKAADRVRAAGYRVDLVLGIVDRLEGGREALAARSLQLVSLFDRRDFVES